MAEAGLAFADLDRIAVTVGPGSFTGVRVGIAAARGLALVTGCPVVGIGTLAVHAEKARARSRARARCSPLLDARRGEVYGQAFAADGAPLGAARGRLAGRTSPRASARDMLLAGSGAAARRRRAWRSVRAAHRPSRRRARSSPRSSGSGSRRPPPGAPPRPLYLRPPDAKPQAAAAVARR